MATKPPDPENGTMPERLRPAEEMLDEHDRPRWDVIEAEVVCSRCAYNLRGLAEPRCPECGLQFPWREVLDSVGRTTNWLFEHNWTKRPVRSYVATVLREMRGPGFWREISIHHYVTVPPLLLMCLMMPAWCFAVSLPVAFSLAIALKQCLLAFAPPDPSGQTLILSSSDSPIVAAFAHVHGALDSYVTGFLSDPIALSVAYGCALAAFAATAIVLCSLRETIAKHRVRTIHVLRVASHSAMPIGVSLGVLIPLLCFLSPLRSMGPVGYDAIYWIWMFANPALIISLPAIQLSWGLKRYLGIEAGLIAAGGACVVGILCPFVLLALVLL